MNNRLEAFKVIGSSVQEKARLNAISNQIVGLSQTLP